MMHIIKEFSMFNLEYVYLYLLNLLNVQLIFDFQIHMLYVIYVIYNYCIIMLLFLYYFSIYFLIIIQFIFLKWSYQVNNLKHEN